MAKLAAVELLNGSWLGMDIRGADQSVAAELEIWALVPERRGYATTRSGRSWEDVLDAGPLLHAVRSRSMAEAACRAFESTTRHLTAWWNAEHQLLTPEQAADRARWVCWVAREAPGEDESAALRCGVPVTADGGWTVDIESWVAHCDADGLVTLLVPAAPAGQLQE